MLVDPGGGGAAPQWTGTIQVVPGNLQASAPSFSAGGDQVSLALAMVLAWSDPGGTGITDPGTAGAWSRLTAVWNKDLGVLGAEYAQTSGSLSTAGTSYQQDDDSTGMEY